MPLTLKVRETLSATPRARIVRIDLAGRSFSYRAGQAVFVGMSGSATRRPYSLAGSPEDARRDGCLELLMGIDSAKPDPLAVVDCTRVDVDGPVGHFTFPLQPVERHFIFIAGGTGIAPLRAMLRQALDIPGSDILLLYSARMPGDFAYEDELSGLARLGRIQFRQTVTRCGRDEEWTGGRGRIGRKQLQPLVKDPATLWFICGPMSFVADTKGRLQELGANRERIRTEEWGARPAVATASFRAVGVEVPAAR